MAQALREFVEKDERDAISTVVKWQLDQAQKHLNKRQNVREENIETEVCKHTEEIRKKEDDNDEEDAESIRKVSNETYSAFLSTASKRVMTRSEVPRQGGHRYQTKKTFSK